MSLIEKALEKARGAGERSAARKPGNERPAADSPSKTVPPVRPTRSVSVAKPPVPREAAAPQLQVTDALLRESGVRAPQDVLYQQMSEYRHIKRQLITRMTESQDDNRRLFLVTSALAGDGKTYSAINLALSLAAERDYAVLLVDADVIRPTVSRIFGLADRSGLMDVTTREDLDVESLVVSTDVEGLSILPAGQHHANATEYFASARMHEVLTDLMGPPNRIVVVDSLPLLLTTEARALAPCAGQVLLVVRAEVTPQSAVNQAVDLLEGAANVSLILNGVERDKLSRFYSHGYHYSYNYGEEAAK